MDKDQTNTDAMEAELKTRFGLLPKEIQNVITSSDYQTKLFEIAKKYKLTYEQLGSLEFNTTLTLVGVLDPKDYEGTLANDLNKKKEEAAPIIAEVSEQVFKPIRSLIVDLYKEPAEEENETQSAQPAMGTSEKDLFAKAGVSINTAGAPASAARATPAPTENRADMIKGIENPVKSAPRVLNEAVQAKPAPQNTAPASSLPITKSPGLNIPVPMAPYAGGAPSADAVKKEIPMTAKPAGDIMAGKLGGTFSMPAKETDHSLKQGAAPQAPLTSAAPGTDPYHEPIE